MDRCLESRVRVLTEIADRYGELVDPLNGPSGTRGDGDSLPLMPKTYTATVREFERLKLILRTANPRLHWHLVAYHIQVTRAQKLIPRAVKRRNRHTEWKLEPRIVVYRHPQASQTQAGLAIHWMAEHWTLPAEPMLPNELLTPGHAATTTPASSTTPAPRTPTPSPGVGGTDTK